MYFKKVKYLTVDFNGNKILSDEDHVIVRSLWCINLKENAINEIVPFGNFDIGDIYITKNYVYFLKIIDKDQDGNLNDDFPSGEVWRVDKQSGTIEMCFDCGNYIFHGFEAANDRYVIFCSQDRVPDLTEIVIIDVLDSKYTVISVPADDEQEDNYDYHFITDYEGAPQYLLSKRWVPWGEAPTSTNQIRYYLWMNVVSQLTWRSI